MDINIYDVLAEIEANVADEAEAIEGYFKLMSSGSKIDFFTPSEIDDLEEIISEELKHIELLREMVYRRTKIKAEK